VLIDVLDRRRMVREVIDPHITNGSKWTAVLIIPYTHMEQFVPQWWSYSNHSRNLIRKLPPLLLI
jgi:hypothetical protein